ncbi:MAG: hypothetical protein HPY59_12490 [Anaerolineae bacterium]|nr:hypothetical protein [Anaerolineae bacterium]
MKQKRLVLFILLLSISLTACKTVKNMNKISQISYTSDSGTILPELQWHEQITITPGEVTLARNGKTPDSIVNAGTWDFAVEGQKTATLFEQLEAIDCSAIQRIEPQDPPDGGGSEAYTLLYANGDKCSLVYDPGTSYTNGEEVVKLVQAFIQNLTLPAEIASRHNLPSP